jgi:hypothetical protein
MTTVGSRKKDLEKGMAPPIRYNGSENRARFRRHLIRQFAGSNEFLA